jgi:hypothetical protein
MVDGIRSGVEDNDLVRAVGRRFYTVPSRGDAVGCDQCSRAPPEGELITKSESPVAVSVLERCDVLIESRSVARDGLRETDVRTTVCV